MRKKIDHLAVRLFTALFFIFLSFSVFAQKTVKGNVVSGKDNAPISGASVVVKGTTTGVTTENNGTFSINVPIGKNTLVISYVGFADYEANIASSDNVTVTLQEKTSSLDEIVVTGYTTQKKRT